MCYRHARLAVYAGEAWTPSEERFQMLLALQPAEERQRISRFRFRKDAKLALVGRLLLQHTACTALAQPFGMIDFARTKQGKPFLSHTTAITASDVDLCKYNLNLSHHGSWVFIASDHQALVGADVMTTTPPRGGETPETFFRDFQQCLTSDEWAAIRLCGPQGDNALFRAFFVFWTLKEAYIKAVGIGLGLELSRLEFQVPQPLLLGKYDTTSDRQLPPECLHVGQITMFLDGNVRNDWSFEVGEIDSDHVVAVARGPLSDALPDFRDALQTHNHQ
eukprot:CAMPEP_0179410260 /NCGR_PEP_ID=MMETSP0799-20121207/3182_1 /TAXON_ID=46947 /ORGANISM="Geminigera cryophila, Strain CCMP2564" /LENGTH=276 /DNA_ID=CAMNT_0021182077 /DNA_START=42 /DNA_END=872 /DNA_ORIENTATION=-